MGRRWGESGPRAVRECRHASPRHAHRPGRPSFRIDTPSLSTPIPLLTTHLPVLAGQDQHRPVVAARCADAPPVHQCGRKGRRRVGGRRPAGHVQLFHDRHRDLVAGRGAGRRPAAAGRGAVGRPGRRDIPQDAFERVRARPRQHPVGIAHPGPVQAGGGGRRAPAGDRVGRRVGVGRGGPAAGGRAGQHVGLLIPKWRDGRGGGRVAAGFHNTATMLGSQG